MNEPFTVARYTGDFSDLLELLQMSMGVEALSGVQRLLEIEKVRGTLYYTANVEDRPIGLIGVYFDPANEVTELEPPQIIDMAVLPDYRRNGVARALMDEAVRAVREAGYDRVWLYTDGNSTGLFTFYRRLGFKLAGIIPDWFGDGSVKAYFRRDLA